MWVQTPTHKVCGRLGIGDRPILFHFDDFGMKGSHMGVSKNRGIPKWLVYFMENPFKMDDLAGFPIIFELTPI